MNRPPATTGQPGATGQIQPASRNPGTEPAPRTWGWITLIIGVLQLLAAAGVLAGNQLARWFAVAVLGLNAIDMMFFIPAYPFWALVIIAVDVVALYGLCAYGSRANLTA
jgi:hypothetical protein